MENNRATNVRKQYRQKANVEEWRNRKIDRKTKVVQWRNRKIDRTGNVGIEIVTEISIGEEKARK